MDLLNTNLNMQRSKISNIIEKLQKMTKNIFQNFTKSYKNCKKHYFLYCFLYLMFKNHYFLYGFLDLEEASDIILMGSNLTLNVRIDVTENVRIDITTKYGH